jgi:ABC-type antimicrobial peptide transport system permease subunit
MTITQERVQRERFSTSIRRFKGFWSLYKTSRIGMFGLSLVFAFIVVALITP